MFDKNGNSIKIESKIYVDGVYGVVVTINEESNCITITVDGVECDYNSFKLLIIEDNIYTNLEAIDSLISETKTDIEWSDDDDTIVILEEKIENLEKEKKLIIEQLELRSE